MLVAASVLPHPPLLIPEVSVRAPDWLVELRRAVDASVRALLDTGPDVVVAVGSASAADEWDEAAGGTMARFGVDVRAGGGAEPVLPLPLTIAARVLDDAGWNGPRRYAALADDAAADSHAEVGRRLAASAERVAMLAMGDGSAKRTTEAPGYLDERAEAFDANTVAALGAGDPTTLLGTARQLADELWAQGLPAWQALAGALGADAAVDALVRYDAAPRGVGYFVVDWIVRTPTA
jgi:hypothetical protein